MMNCFVYAFTVTALAGAVTAKADDVTPTVKFVLKSDKDKYQSGRMLKIVADGVGSDFLLEIDGLVDDGEQEGKVYRCVPKASGLPIRFRGYSVVGGKIVKTELLIQAEAPVVPPEPVGPVGPVIPPPKPAPADALTVELLKITDENSRKDLKALAALYTLMATESLKPEYDTTLALNARYKDSCNIMLSDKLLNVRTLLSLEIIKVAGDVADTQLTDDSRKLMATLFTRLSIVCLEAAK